MKNIQNKAQFIGGILDGRLIDAKLSFFEISAAVDTPEHPGHWARNYRRIERPSKHTDRPQAFFIDKTIEEAQITDEIERCRTQSAPLAK